MLYYSTNHKAERATLREAVVRGLAEDRGLYMPEVIKQMPASFWDEIADLSFQEVAYRVADAFFGEDVEAEALRRIVYDTLQFDTPVVHVKDNIYALELFHGPTLAFKDVGARFMARLLRYLLAPYNPTAGDEGSSQIPGGPVNVLVATSGDTGSAVANGFLGVEGIHVYVLYPKGKVSPIQECQFTTLGQNITAIEVDGVFDDCQRLVKSAFMDADLNAHMRLTSANSINVARFLPQAFYYFWAYAQMKKKFRDGSLEFSEKTCQAQQSSGSEQSALNSQPSTLNLTVCVPSGNFGNICSALFGHVMGLPVKRFIAANNANDVFYQYLQTGVYTPKPSVQTIANAMDVGDPSNFARIVELYRPTPCGPTPCGPTPSPSLVGRGVDTDAPGGSVPSADATPSAQTQTAPSLQGRAGGGSSAAQTQTAPSLQGRAGGGSSTPLPTREGLGEGLISGATYTDQQIAETMRQCYAETGYVLDPHGACGYRALTEQLAPDEIGIFLETAHPAKFKDTVDRILGTDIPIPARLQAFMQGQKQSVPMSKDFADFKAYLLQQE